MPDTSFKSLFIARDFPPQRGGMARLYAELCRHFPAGALEIATYNEPGAEQWDHEFLPGLHVHRLPSSFLQSRRITHTARWARWTARRVGRGDIAVLQIGELRPTAYIGALLKRRVSYVLYVHGRDLWKEQRKSERSARTRWTARAIFGGASAIIANSSATATIARSLLATLSIQDRGQIHVVHPGTDPVRFRPDAAGADVWRRELALHERIVLLSVSRLMPRKGIDVVLRTLPELILRHPQLIYVIGGTGNDEARLRALSHSLDLDDHVRFLGDVPEARLPALYAAADIFVLPAREERARDEIEGFGIVFCEAAAAGLPVVAGDSGGVAEAVRAGESALLVAPTDERAVLQALDRLARDPELRRRLGAAGRHSVETYYNWRRAADQAWRIVAGVAAGH